jgi:hypothetical protein
MRRRYWKRPHDSHLLVAATMLGTKSHSESSTRSLYFHRTINPSWIAFRDTCYFVHTARTNAFSFNDSHTGSAGEMLFTAICQPLYQPAPIILGMNHVLILATVRYHWQSELIRAGLSVYIIILVMGWVHVFCKSEAMAVNWRTKDWNKTKTRHKSEWSDSGTHVKRGYVWIRRQELHGWD